MEKKQSNDASRSRVEAWSGGRVDQDQPQNAQAERAPDPSDRLPALDEDQLSVLRRVGSEWDRVSGDPQVWRRALPGDPDVGSYPAATDIQQTRLGRFVRVSLQTGQPPEVEATSAAEVPSSLLDRLGYDLKRFVLGPPLKSVALAQERMRKLVALAVLSADALSSVAYGPESMLVILVLAGSAGLSYALPLAAVIAFMIVAVGISYRQTIRAYPHGGRSYIVASDNLGDVPGLAAAAGLLTDYVLTVAVSVASGVAAITSALPRLSPATVPIGVGVIAVLFIGNLRGIRQAGVLFAAPTYAFIVAMVVLIAGSMKFTAGAWISLLMIGLFILVALRIRHHFTLAGKALALEAGAIEVPQHPLAPSAGSGAARAAAGVQGHETEGGAEETPEEVHHLLLVPVAEFNRASMRALAYAASLQQPVLALHLSPTEEEAKRFGDYWRLWGDHLPLQIVISPYRAIVAPMINYIEVVHRQRPDLTLTVILPEIVVRHWWHRILHNQIARRLRRALRPVPKIVVTTVPFHLPS